MEIYRKMTRKNNKSILWSNTLYLQNLFIAECAAPLQPAIRQKNYKQLFSIKALKEDLPGRLSTALDLPVCQSDCVFRSFSVLSAFVSFISQSNVVCIKKLEYLIGSLQIPGQTTTRNKCVKEQLLPSIASKTVHSF